MDDDHSMTAHTHVSETCQLIHYEPPLAGASSSAATPNSLYYRSYQISRPYDDSINQTAPRGIPLWFPVSPEVYLYSLMKAIDRTRLQSLMQREQKKFVDERPKSKALFDRARKSLLAGVPMNWMVKWAGAFPPFVREAQGAEFFDVDGLRYVDFCLGDTGAMTGHSPFATVKAAEEQMRRGITLMLPEKTRSLSPRNCRSASTFLTGNSR